MQEVTSVLIFRGIQLSSFFNILHMVASWSSLLQEEVLGKRRNY